MRSLSHVAVIAAFLGSAPVFAANVIDQSQNSGPLYMANFGQGGLAQSFTAGATNSSGGGVELQDTATSAFTVNFGLYTALPSAGGTLLASGIANVVTGDQWANAFWAPVTVTSGTQYFLTFGSTSNAGVKGAGNNPYAGGQVYANNYGSFPSYDYTFHTFTNNSVGSVPEPTSWAFLVVGLGLVGVAARRRTTVVTA